MNPFHIASFKRIVGNNSELHQSVNSYVITHSFSCSLKTKLGEQIQIIKPNNPISLKKKTLQTYTQCIFMEIENNVPLQPF